MASAALKQWFAPYVSKNTECFSLKGFSTFARVVSIYDADTITVVMDLQGCCMAPCGSIEPTPESCMRKFSVRLFGIDAAEMKNANKALQHVAIKARDRLVELITGKKDMDLESDVYVVWVQCEEFDKYGRLLARVYSIDSATGKVDRTKSLSDMLLAENLVYAYKGKTKLSPEEQCRVFEIN